MRVFRRPLPLARPNGINELARECLGKILSRGAKFPFLEAIRIARWVHSHSAIRTIRLFWLRVLLVQVKAEMEFGSGARDADGNLRARAILAEKWVHRFQ